MAWKRGRRRERVSIRRARPPLNKRFRTRRWHLAPLLLASKEYCATMEDIVKLDQKFAQLMKKEPLI